jgi:hypothetical protein
LIHDSTTLFLLLRFTSTWRLDIEQSDMTEKVMIEKLPEAGPKSGRTGVFAGRWASAFFGLANALRGQQKKWQ